MKMTREDIANKLADEGWCPDSECHYLEVDRGFLITKRMYVSDEAIDDYIKENGDD